MSASCDRCKRNNDVMCIQVGDTLVLTLAKNGKVTIHSKEHLALAVQLINREITDCGRAIDSAANRLSLYAFLAGALAQTVETVAVPVGETPFARA